MKLTVGVLKKVIADLPDETILASLGVGNSNFAPFISLKRLLLLRSAKNGKEYLTINEMGSHFTQQGDQKDLIYMSTYWNDDSINQQTLK